MGTRAYLVIEMQREIITALGEGDRGLIPPVVEEVIGVGLLDIVHPVDRATVGSWLGAGFGVSPPFRRAAADEPPRWFRFIVAAPVRSGAACTVLMEEVTEIVRDDLLRERLSSTLARHTGEELVLWSPAVAADLAGAEEACLAQFHPPLAVVKASYGRMVLAPGTTFSLADSPLSRLNVDSGILEFTDNVQEVFPNWGPFRLAGARSAVIVPVAHASGEDLVGGFICCSSVPRSLTGVERELLGFLAVRLGAELGSARTAAGTLDVEIPYLEMSEGFLRVLAMAIAGRGITHTLNNLLGGQLLNAELAAKQVKSGQSPGPVYLERLIMASRKGAAIMRRLSELSGWELGQRDFVAIGPIVEEAVQLVHDLYEANRVEVRKGDCPAIVWGDSRLLHAMILALVAPAVERMGPETSVVLEVSFAEEESAVHVDIEVFGPPGEREEPEGLKDGLQLGRAVASRVAALHGGRLDSGASGVAGKTRVTIRAMAPKGRTAQP